MSAISVDKKIEIGQKAPVIETIDGIKVTGEQGEADKTRIISFWNPKVPSSRIANKNYYDLYASGKENIEFISICTDSDIDLMYQVMGIDGVNPEYNYSYSEISPRVFKDYGVEETPKVFKISSDGKISAFL